MANSNHGARNKHHLSLAAIFSTYVNSSRHMFCATRAKFCATRPRSNCTKRAT